MRMMLVSVVSFGRLGFMFGWNLRRIGTNWRNGMQFLHEEFWIIVLQNRMGSISEEQPKIIKCCISVLVMGSCTLRFAFISTTHPRKLNRIVGMIYNFLLNIGAICCSWDSGVCARSCHFIVQHWNVIAWRQGACVWSRIFLSTFQCRVLQAPVPPFRTHPQELWIEIYVWNRKSPALHLCCVNARTPFSIYTNETNLRRDSIRYFSSSVGLFRQGTFLAKERVLFF